MQTAGYLVSPTTEFAAGMKDRKDNLYRRNTGFFLNADRNAATIIQYRDGIVLINGDVNPVSQCFIYRIIYNLINQVMKSPGRSAANIHTRSLPDRFQPFQDLNLVCSVFCTHVISS